jgi:beta-lactamase class A
VPEPLPHRLVELLNPPTGTVALAARHLETGRTWRHTERVVMPSASLVKLPILATFWEATERGGSTRTSAPTFQLERRSRARGC